MPYDIMDFNIEWGLKMDSWRWNILPNVRESVFRIGSLPWHKAYSARFGDSA